MRKRIKCSGRILALILPLLLILWGCAPRMEQPKQTEPSAPVPEQTAAAETAAAPICPEGEILFSGADRVRVDYTGQEQWVRYITSPEQLPEHPALESFDAEFFRENALVLVKITLNSGSILPELEAIRCIDGCAEIILRRTAPGGDMTDDMASWLLWARVDRNLACEWFLEGEQAPAGEKY